MLSEKLNILAFNTGENLTHLISGIFSSLNYELTSIKGQEIPFQRLSENFYDLIIIDGAATALSPADFKQIQLVSPQTHLVLILKDLSHLKQWSEFKHLNIILHSSLSERLPIVLSDFYSEFTSQHLSNLYYWKLIKVALETNGLFTAILDEKSHILFLNKVGQEILKISFDEESSLKFCDFMKEGEKVWKFFTGKFDNQSLPIIKMQLQLIDRNFNEFSFPVSVRKVSNGLNYFIIQGTGLTEKISTSAAESETILDSFADSLANELLNPLNIIWGRLQLFQTSRGLNSQEKHHLELIENQIQRINEVITKLVSFTSIKRDLVPQKIFLNEIINRLIYLPSMKKYLEKKPQRLQFKLGKNLPPLYGQIAHFELLFNMIIDLILNLTPAKSKIIIETISEKSLTDNKEKVIANFTIENYMETADQHLLKSSLHFEKNGKKRFALELTIIRFILEEYKIKHQLREDSSSLILLLNFPST